MTLLCFLCHNLKVIICTASRFCQTSDAPCIFYKSQRLFEGKYLCNSSALSGVLREKHFNSVTGSKQDEEGCATFSHHSLKPSARTTELGEARRRNEDRACRGAKYANEAILGGAPSSQTPGANNGCYIRSINVIWISPAEIWRSGKQEPAAADHTEESHLCDFTVSPSFMQVSQKYSEFVENRVYFYLN